MGRKGGGRAGFMKAARHGPESDGEEEAGAPPAAKPAAAPAQPPAPAAAPAKAAKFLKDEPGAAEESSDEEPRREGGETRGQVLQRHKRVSGRLLTLGARSEPARSCWRALQSAFQC